jgi:predicted Zn-dependent protease
MDADDASALFRRAWAHIDAKEYAEAEGLIRRVIELTPPNDSLRLWELNGLLATIMNSLGRPAEATERFERALSQAVRARPGHTAIEVARYMLANQYLLHGAPGDALAQVELATGIEGHTGALLQGIAARALWKLERRDEARAAAARALDAAPTCARRDALAVDLDEILKSG